MEEKQATCPQCGKPVSERLFGLCPECMLKAGIATGTGQHGRFEPPTTESLAKSFPQLEILGLIGRGGMGAVYKARQKQLDRVVALKILPPDVAKDGAFAERFAKEARALAAMSHPNIVTLYEFGEADGLYFFLMEYVDGVNLRQLMSAGKLAPKEALAIVPQICDALQYAHDRGIVHRDIKPENILIGRDGVVKIADFGVAKILGEKAEKQKAEGRKEDTGATIGQGVVGTPAYMAPEQVEHPAEVDHRADIYSLGVVLYQMLTGELPADRIEPPSRKVQIDVRIDEIVLRALEREPERRYETAAALKTQIQTAAGGPELQQGPERDAATAGSVRAQHAPPLPYATAGTSARRLSRAALAGVGWAGLFLLVVPPFVAHELQTHEFTNHGPFASLLGAVVSFGILLPAFVALLGTPVLGYIAASQIRQSTGRLYGLPLAVFDLLLFPLLVLDALIAVAWLALVFLVWPNSAADLGSSIYGWMYQVVLATVLTTLSAGAADYLVVRWTWRRLTQTAPRSDRLRQSHTPAISTGWRAATLRTAVAMAVHLCLAAVIATVIVFMVPPILENLSRSDAVLPAPAARAVNAALLVGRNEEMGWALLAFDVIVCVLLARKRSKGPLVAWGAAISLALVGYIVALLLGLTVAIVRAGPVAGPAPAAAAPRVSRLEGSDVEPISPAKPTRPDGKSTPDGNAKVVPLGQGDGPVTQRVGWRAAYAEGQQLASRPAEQGLIALRERWATLDVESRQQMLKAFAFAGHERLADVLDLGMRDPSPAVQNWAIQYLRSLALRDFAEDLAAYENWYAGANGKTTGDVFRRSLDEWIDGAYDRKVLGRGLTCLPDALSGAGNSLHHISDAQMEELRTLLGDVIREDRAAQRVTALKVARCLPVDEQWQRNVILPVLAGGKPEERIAAVQVLGRPGNTWAVAEIVRVLKASVQARDRVLIWTAATALGEIADPKVIPELIELIAADNTYDTVYGIGYFGLSRLTGVEYNEKHNGAWWREWWKSNAGRFGGVATASAAPQPQVAPTTTTAPAAPAQDNAAARIRLQEAETRLARIEELRKADAVSPLEYEQAKLARDVAAAEARGDQAEVARLKLEFAEQRLGRIEELAKHDAASFLEVDDAKLARDVAAAELRGDGVGVARLRYEYTERRLQRVEEVYRNGGASPGEVEQARTARDLAKAEYEQVKAGKGSDGAPATQYSR